LGLPDHPLIIGQTMASSGHPLQKDGMITVHIRYYNLAADYMRIKREDRDLPRGSTCLDLVILLAGGNDSFRRLAMNDDGSLSSRLRLFRNGNIVFNMDEILQQGDEVIIFPAVSGGSGISRHLN